MAVETYGPDLCPACSGGSSLVRMVVKCDKCGQSFLPGEDTVAVPVETLKDWKDCLMSGGRLPIESVLEQIDHILQEGGGDGIHGSGA